LEILLDTHVWVWSLWDDERLTPAAREALSRAEAVRVSPISFYEIGQKVRIGKWPEMAPHLHGLPARLREQGGQAADLTMDVALLASQFDWPHRDPFDRIIAATAVQSGATLLSADRAFDTLENGGLQRIW
jgi:PIN domain nuclease of toxin-antitoxin system